MSSPQAIEALKPTRWKKGVSPNPGGKPKFVGERDWQIARRHTAEAIDKILEFMRGRVKGFERRPTKADPNRMVAIEYVAPATLQLQAAGMLLERGWGKAPQALAIVETDKDEPTAKSEVSALEVIRSRLAGIATRLEEGGDITDVEPDPG